MLALIFIFVVEIVKGEARLGLEDAAGSYCVTELGQTRIIFLETEKTFN